MTPPGGWLRDSRGRAGVRAGRSSPGLPSFGGSTTEALLSGDSDRVPTTIGLAVVARREWRNHRPPSEQSGQRSTGIPPGVLLRVIFAAQIGQYRVIVTGLRRSSARL